MKQKLSDLRKVRSRLKLSSEPPPEAERGKGFFRRNPWRFSRKTKCLIAFAIVAIVLVSSFAFLSIQSGGKDNVAQNGANSTATPSPTNNQGSNESALSSLAKLISQIAASAASALSPPNSRAPVLIGSSQVINSTVWRGVAANAWTYFQPGIGVDPNTGLPYAGGATGFHYFTDWDLGVYIQAVIDAQKIGLIGTDGAWDSYARLDKVLTFLQTRPLNTTTGYPFWFYDAETGQDYHSLSDLTTAADTADTGRLLVALNNLKAYNHSWASRINNIVYNSSNYAALVPGIKDVSANSTSIYDYYITSGYESFWPDALSNATTTIMNNILSAGNVTTYGVSLPKAKISCDPLLCSVFELNNNDSNLMALTNQVYLAHEAYFNATGQFAAFSEGNSPDNGFIYEWVVMPNGDTWKITTSGDISTYLNINPIIYNKVAFSFLALYNTTYAKETVIFLERILPDPINGYSDGADNMRNLVSQVGSNTNGLILDAALYAIQNGP